ncbi:hypothetical protein EYC84_002133 [Monilinia fructicola]|uniref:Uncharacterized protein n=1 Tax=Monilinia fructicola TaxID=38448 RepID=A0A5M9JRU4_MONFR|nr:hypothetical protein EYC84_002133 [Monilinia fructicola]
MENKTKKKKTKELEALSYYTRAIHHMNNMSRLLKVSPKLFTPLISSSQLILVQHLEIGWNFGLATGYNPRYIHNLVII